MWAGTLAMLDEPADEPLQTDVDYGTSGHEIGESYGYLDGERVQSGIVAGRVPTQEERVRVDKESIEVETVDTEELVATEFLSDVEQGWILSERTHTSEDDWLPDWPFSHFGRVTGREVVPTSLDVGAFVKRQEKLDRGYSVEMASIEKEHSENVRIQWGGADNHEGQRSNVGVALTTEWSRDYPRVVVYESGYMAVWNSGTWTAEMAGRFVSEEIVPIARQAETEEIEQDEEAGQTEVDQHA